MQEDAMYMRLALAEAELALAEGEFPVGCVLVEADGRLLAQGRRRNSKGGERNELDHAETSTLRLFLRSNPGYDLSRASVYSTLEPCLMCYSTLLLAGLRRFVWAYEDVMGGGASVVLADLAPLYAQMRVQLLGGVLRRESLTLFQQFFQTGDYWRGSLLAKAVLAESKEQ